VRDSLRKLVGPPWLAERGGQDRVVPASCGACLLWCHPSFHFGNDEMNYSMKGFIETLELERRNWLRSDFIDPISRATYGFIFKLRPITYLKVTGWHGEKIKVIKIFGKELVWERPCQ